jgi:cell division protein FtsB
MLKNAIWLFVLTVVVLAVFLPSYAKMLDLKQKNRAYVQQIADLHKRNAQLEQEKHLLETDPAYLEKVGRAQMGLIREGEKIYTVAPATKPVKK